MPFKIMIEADSLDTVQAALIGAIRTLTEGTGPVVTSDQAPSDIVQGELKLCQTADAVPAVNYPGASSFPESLKPGLDAMLKRYEEEPEPVKETPKKRGRPPKASHPVKPVVVEDVEPPPEVITEEEEPEAEGAVDTPEPQAASGVTEQMLRDLVSDAMDEHGIPKVLIWMAKATGHEKVKQIPVAEYDRAYAALKSLDVLDA